MSARWLCIAVLGMVLAACGGGGGEEASSANHPDAERAQSPDLNGEISVVMDVFPDGSAQPRTASAWPRTFGLALDAAANLRVSDPTVHAVYRIDSSGNSTLLAGTLGVSGNSD